MERMLLRYDHLVTITTARTDGATSIVRRVLPWQLPPPATASIGADLSAKKKNAAVAAGGLATTAAGASAAVAAAISAASPISVTAEAVHILSLMKSMDAGLRCHSNLQQQGGGSRWVRFDEVARCMSPDALTKLDRIGKNPFAASFASSSPDGFGGADDTAAGLAPAPSVASSSIFQLLQFNKFLEADIRMVVRETRSSNSCLVLLDVAAISSKAAPSAYVQETVQQMLLKASSSAPHAKIISARKKDELPYSAQEDVIAPAWMPSSVVLLAQLAKHLARSTEEAAAQLRTVYVIVPAAAAGTAAEKEAARTALADEIKQLVGPSVKVEFL
jgi:hypothetical protein